MPTTDDIRKRSELRQLRKQQKQSAVEQAHSESVTLAEVSQQQAAAKDEAAPAEKPATRQPERPTADTRAKAKAQQKAASRRAAEVQAEKDVRRSPEPVDLERVELENAPGASLTLHQLNAIAERLDREVRDEGKEIANAAAKGAYETYVGRLAGKRSRHAHMRAQMQAGEQQLIARRAAEAAKSETA